MATHDMNLANQSGASFRSDLNNALSAILSNNSNASSPATTVAYMIWADTNNNKLKIRNSADDGWVDLINLDGTIARDLTLTGASANIVFDQSDNALEFADNAKATFGTAADLTISHNGSNSIINDSGTGELQLQRAGNTILTVDGSGIEITDPSGSSSVVITGFEGHNANLELKADQGDDDGDRWIIQSQASSGKLKFYNDVSGSNAEVWAIAGDGDVTMTGHLKIPDNHQLQLGDATSGDLRISHDGTNSIINDAGTGELRLQRAGNTVLSLGAAGIEISDPSGAAEVTITASEGANSQIRMAADEGDDNGDTWLIQSNATSNTLRFLNDTSGTQITKWTLDTSGNVTQTGDLDLPDDKKIKLGDGDDLTIGHISNVNVIDIASDLFIKHGSENCARFNDDGAVSFFHNNEQRFITTSTGVTISRDSTGNDCVLIIQNDSSDSASDTALRIAVGGTDQHSIIQFGDSGDTNNGQIDYDHNSVDMTFSVNGAATYEMDAGAFHPVTDDVDDLGRSGQRWDDVRASNNVIQTSDRNEKNTIVASDLGLDFINKLSPVSYKFNNKTRTHYGLIAQDIETLLGTIGKSATDFAGFCKDEITYKVEIDEDGKAEEIPLETPFNRYALRYTEFIAPMVKAIQELSAKVTALEGS